MTDFTHPGSGSCTLSDWRVVAIEGPDAASFLQGQLTQDVANLPPTEARLGGYCSAKGRLMATGVLWRPSAERILWALPAALVPGLLKRLQMFVMRAKVRLSETELSVVGVVDQPTDLPVWGCAATYDGSLTRLPDALGRTRLLQLGGAPKPPALAREAWDWLEVHAGQPWVHPATAEHFVPQMLNWELLGGVNFQKGCYPGQEVVARSQYRGTIKRRTHLFLADQAAELASPLVHSADPTQPAGQVVACATWQGQTVVLAEVKLAALEDGALHLADANNQALGGALQLLQLPYAITAPQ